MNRSICIIGSNLNRQDARIFWRQGLSLVSAGYSVTYIVSDNEPEEIINKIKIIPTRFLANSRIKRLLFSKKYFYRKAIEVNSDLYQISSPELIGIGIKLKKRGKKVIFDLREDYTSFVREMTWIPTSFLRLIISNLAKMYLNKTLNKYHAVIGVTPNIFENLKISASITCVVTNYPNITNTSETSIADYLKRKNNICYIGSVYRKSNQNIIFNVIQGFQDLNYTIMGNIEQNLKLELSEIPYWSKINYIQSWSKLELQKVLKCATIGNAIIDYSPNLGYKKGSLGVIKLFEYMEAGIPVICTDFILWKEIINKYKCGICVNPKNENEIRSAISYLLNNKIEAFQMGQNGRRAILEEYNWESQSIKYKQIINKL